MNTTSRILTACAVALVVSSCGGGGSPTGPTSPGGGTAGTPTPTATPAGTATPPPTPTPPFEDDNSGPVVSVSTRLFVVASEAPNNGGTLREGPFYDPNTNTDVIRIGEFVIFDTTPKNALGEKCQARNTPQWVFENRGLFQHVVGSQPFQYRVYAFRKGITQVYTIIDGVRSEPILNIEIR